MPLNLLRRCCSALIHPAHSYSSFKALPRSIPGYALRVSGGEGLTLGIQMPASSFCPRGCHMLGRANQAAAMPQGTWVGAGGSWHQTCLFHILGTAPELGGHCWGRMGAGRQVRDEGGGRWGEARSAGSHPSVMDPLHTGRVDRPGADSWLCQSTDGWLGKPELAKAVLRASSSQPGRD